jgi:hypothetical protein
MQSKENMSNSDHSAKYIIGAWWLFLLLLVVGFFTGFFYIKEEAPQPQISSWNDTMCLAGVLDPTGGTISEIAAGTYAYTLIARADGSIEVWKECDNSIIK